LGSFGSDDEHFIFNVAASARPMIAGERSSPAAAAVDDVTNVRRLTGTMVMMLLSPTVLVSATAFVAARMLYRL
jgi:hypothetical protein